MHKVGNYNVGCGCTTRNDNRVPNNPKPSSKRGLDRLKCRGVK